MAGKNEIMELNFFMFFVIILLFYLFWWFHLPVPLSIFLPCSRIPFHFFIVSHTCFLSIVALFISFFLFPGPSFHILSFFFIRTFLFPLWLIFQCSYWFWICLGKVITAAYVPVVNYHNLFPDSINPAQLVQARRWTPSTPPSQGCTTRSTRKSEPEMI